ncbi:MAG: hypothetical protein WC712_02335 [Candidatus Brocadiia bacterium]
MRRWALVLAGTAVALYLMLSAVMPTFQSSADDQVAISSQDNDGADMERGTTEKKRPKLGGAKPAASVTPTTPAPGKSGTVVTKPKPTKTEKTRPTVNGPKPSVPPSGAPVSVAPGTSPKPVNPVKTTVPVTPVGEQAKTIEELQKEIDVLRRQVQDLAAGGVKGDEAKAKAILDRLAEEEKAQKALNKRQAELDYQAAGVYVTSGRYAEAYEKAVNAYKLDPTNQAYAERVNFLAQLLGRAPESTNSGLLYEQEAKQRAAAKEIEINIDTAKNLYAEATVLTGTDAVAKLKLARTKLGQAEFSVNGLSAMYRRQGIEKQIKDLIKLVDDMMNSKDIEARSSEQDAATKMASDMAKIEREYLIKRINDLIDRAYLAINTENYTQAEMLLEKVTKLDPANREAKYLLRMVQAKGDAALGKELDIRNKLETSRTDLVANEMLIPYHEILVYPDNWEQIDRTRSAATEIREVVPEWKKLIMAKMERKVNVSFMETPISEVVRTLSGLIDVAIILDTASAEGVTAPITIDLPNMTFKTVLDWVLRQVGLQWTLMNEAIYIATPDRIQGDKSMQIYDVRDMIGSLTMFPGPNIDITDNEPEFQPPTEPDPEQQLEELVNTIRTKIEPTRWDEASGASIVGREGKLIVTNIPTVHKEIEQLLDSFRKAQKLQVYINARFIQVTNNFLEDIGVSWTGLDRATTPDLRGIAGNAQAGFQSNPADSTGGWNAYDMRGVILNNTSNDISGIANGLGMPYQVGEGLNIQYALLGDFQAEVLLNAIQKSSRGTVLLAPRLTVFNTQRAYMMVATTRSYIADYEGLIATQAAILDPVVKSFNVGMVLDVRPIISSDRKYITVELRPTNAMLMGYDIFHINSAWGQDYPLALPIISIRKVRCTVALPDGGTLLIGGQVDIESYRTTSGVPLLSKIPIIGRLFSHNAETTLNDQLIIFVNARIIMFEEIENQIRAK